MKAKKIFSFVVSAFAKVGFAERWKTREGGAGVGEGEGGIFIMTNETL